MWLGCVRYIINSMDVSELTQQNFIEILSNLKQRQRLSTALRKETPEQLRNIVQDLMKWKGKKGDYDSLLCLFVRHPAMPEDILLELFEQKRCICDLGHLAGPLWLLERLADEEEFSEAITTLAIYYYSTQDYDTAKFAAFLKKHSKDEMLRGNITRRNDLPPEKWQVVYEVFGEDNR